MCFETEHFLVAEHFLVDMAQFNNIKVMERCDVVITCPEKIVHTRETFSRMCYCYWLTPHNRENQRLAKGMANCTMFKAKMGKLPLLAQLEEWCHSFSCRALGRRIKLAGPNHMIFQKREAEWESCLYTDV